MAKVLEPWERDHKPMNGRTYGGDISYRLWVRLDRYLAGLPPVPECDEPPAQGGARR